MPDAAGIETRAAFDRIRYAQVWEDADVLLAGLRVAPGDTVVSIASAGDNVLALLTADPARIVAVDLSDAQLQCLRFRIAAYGALDHGRYLELYGSRRSDRRAELFDLVARRLPDDSVAFWRARKPEVVVHGLGGVGKFERYFRIFRRFVLPLVHGRAARASLLAPRTPPERIAFFVRHWDSWRWRVLVRTFFSRPVMARLGRAPAFFDHVEGSVADHVAAKVRDALTRLDPADNPYLHWILTGTHGAALPLALRPESFETIRGRLDRVEARRSSLDALDLPAETVDAFNLSDVFEYMAPRAFEACYASLLGRARPGARLLHWAMMVPRGVPDGCAGQARRNATLEAALRLRDKVFFYSDLVIAEKNT